MGRIFKLTEAQYKIAKSVNEEIVVSTDKNFKQGTSISTANKTLNSELTQAGINVQNNPNVEKRVEINDPSSRTGELEVTIDDKNPNNKPTQQESKVITMSGIREDVMRKLKANSQVYKLSDITKRNRR